MRWTKPPEPDDCEERLKSYFAFKPVTIKGETRWLERVFILQRYYVNIYTPSAWKNITFIDSIQEKMKWNI